MATITRNGTAGTWTAANTAIWSTGTVPTSADDVIFTSTSAAATPVTAGSTINCNSLTLDSSFTGTVGNGTGVNLFDIAIAGKNGAGNSLDISGGQLYYSDVRVNGTTATTINLSGVNSSAKANFNLIIIGAGPHTLSAGSNNAFLRLLAPDYDGTTSLVTNNCNLSIGQFYTTFSSPTVNFGTSTITITTVNGTTPVLNLSFIGITGTPVFNYYDPLVIITLGGTTVNTLNVSSSTGLINGTIGSSTTVNNLSIVSTAAGSSIGFQSPDGTSSGFITVATSFTMTGVAGKLLTVAGTGDDGFGPYPVFFAGTPATKVFQYLNLTRTTVNTPTWTAVNSTNGGSNSGWAFVTTGGGGSPQLDFCFKLGF
jgi:hypothetical protein